MDIFQRLSTQVSDNIINDIDVGGPDGPKVRPPDAPKVRPSAPPDRPTGERNVDVVASIIQIINMLTTCWTLFNNTRAVVRLVLILFDSNLTLLIFKFTLK